MYKGRNYGIFQKTPKGRDYYNKSSFFNLDFWINDAAVIYKIIRR